MTAASNSTLAGAPKRQLSDCSHDYLVERLIQNEIYTAELVQMLAQFHPYLGPAINAIGEDAMRRFADLEKRYPPSGIILPPN